MSNAVPGEATGIDAQVRPFGKLDDRRIALSHIDERDTQRRAGAGGQHRAGDDPPPARDGDGAAQRARPPSVRARPISARVVAPATPERRWRNSADEPRA